MSESDGGQRSELLKWNMCWYKWWH